MEFSKPSGNGFCNYVWDTNALNRLASDNEMVKDCLEAIQDGHRYYITTVQERELIGVPDRSMKYDDPTKWGKPQCKVFDIMELLKFRRISCVALLYHNFWLLDGSMRILETSGTRIDMFNSIFNNNNHHKRDATIAEAAVYHECILITGDGRLIKQVNRYYPDSAIHFDVYRANVHNAEKREVDSDAD